jgi:hypothetical protein
MKVIKYQFPIEIVHNVIVQVPCLTKRAILW